VIPKEGFEEKSIENYNTVPVMSFIYSWGVLGEESMRTLQYSPRAPDKHA